MTTSASSPTSSCGTATSSPAWAAPCSVSPTPEIYGQIEAHRRRLAEIERERGAIYKQQQQIQGSLAPLGREGDEGALRTRYVGTLGSIEDRLAALADEEQRLNEGIAQLEREAQARLAALSAQA